MAAWRKALIISVALIACVATVASGSESDGGTGDKKDSGSSSSSSASDEKTAAGDADEVDDVKVNSCGKDATLGFASANITVTNDSSDPSDYLIEITFTSKDGTTQIGTGNAIISNLTNGQTKTEDVSSLEDAGDAEIVCTVSKVDRFAST